MSTGEFVELNKENEHILVCLSSPSNEKDHTKYSSKNGKRYEGTFYGIVCTDREKRKGIGQKKTGSSCTICKGIWCGNRNDTWENVPVQIAEYAHFIKCHKNRDRTKQCKEKSSFQQTDINREVDRGCS